MYFAPLGLSWYFASIPPAVAPSWEDFPATCSSSALRYVSWDSTSLEGNSIGGVRLQLKAARAEMVEVLSKQVVGGLGDAVRVSCR
jgi:hypothetical protein